MLTFLTQLKKLTKTIKFFHFIEKTLLLDDGVVVFVVGQDAGV